MASRQNPMNFTHQITGFEDLDDMLTQTGTVLGAKASRKAIRKAMNVVLEEVRNTCPLNTIVQDGVHLKDGFKLKVSGRTAKLKRKGSDVFLAASVVTHGPIEQYAAQVEFGRSAFDTTHTMLFGKTAQPFQVHIGEVQPTPFMRTALYSRADEVTDLFLTELRKELETIAQTRNQIARRKMNAMYNRSRRAAGVP
ncbi:HK97-gp10 family putative phage morphogenesis protein [Aeromonas sobria]|uniref:HK97-gp10 family putative phage morphogenesis protein n=1 Tax=Aeromonas sobria TaxID=646 RepID=UPI000C6D8B18|nr:HK97-gp10 family putative phage morphogenesis protein [Aeromonas sobria]PKQ78086.1 hypothetical protein CJF47_07340 [Aeromonas sobria]